MYWLFFILKLFGALLFITVLVAYIITKSWDDKAKEYLREGCYHVEGLPILGNVLLTLHINHTKDYLDMFTKLANPPDTDAKILYCRILHMRYVLIRDAAIMEQVLQSNNTIGRTSEYSVFRAVATGLFVVDGDWWKKLRKAVNKTFTPDKIDNYFPVQKEKAKILCRCFGKAEGYVNIQPFISRLFFDLIINTHFGIDFNDIEENKYRCTDVLHEMLELAFKYIFPRPYCYNDLLYWRTKWVKRVLAIRGDFYRPIEHATEKRYPEWLKNKEINGNVPQNSIMLDYYFQLIDELNLKQCNRTYNKLTSDIIVAGTDTTSYSTSACLYFLAFYSEWQEKVYQEIQEHWPGDTELTKEMLNKFTSMDMCIRESLRITGPVCLFRPAAEDIYINEHATIPKGSTIAIFMEGLHMNPNYYKHPDKFYPDHFLPEAVAARPKCAFIPFCYGIRGCPGSAYAMQSMKAIIGHVVKEFHMETNLPYEQVEMNLHLMKMFRQGYPIKFTRRKS